MYLTDVTPANGATRFMSRRQTAHVPVEEHTLNLNDYGDLYGDTSRCLGPGRVGRRLPAGHLPPFDRLHRPGAARS